MEDLNIKVNDVLRLKDGALNLMATKKELTPEFVVQDIDEPLDRVLVCNVTDKDYVLGVKIEHVCLLFDPVKSIKPDNSNGYRGKNRG